MAIYTNNVNKVLNKSLILMYIQEGEGAKKMPKHENVFITVIGKDQRRQHILPVQRKRKQLLI